MTKNVSRLRKKLLRLSFLLALATVVRAWIWMPTLIVGNSMLPTFHTGQIAGVNKVIYLFEPPRRGDVIAAWTGKELMIKRVVGLPGDVVEVRDGIFFVGGLELAEKYPHCNDHSNIAPGQLGSNKFVLAGDNRPQSLIAVIDRSRIIGRLTRN
jgi:signal peptidase I